jgi:hypothetical protein
VTVAAIIRFLTVSLCNYRCLELWQWRLVKVFEELRLLVILVEDDSNLPL